MYFRVPPSAASCVPPLDGRTNSKLDATPSLLYLAVIPRPDRRAVVTKPHAWSRTGFTTFGSERVEPRLWRRRLEHKGQEEAFRLPHVAV